MASAALTFCSSVSGPLRNRWAPADDDVHRRAQLVRQIREKVNP